VRSPRDFRWASPERRKPASEVDLDQGFRPTIFANYFKFLSEISKPV